MLLGPVARELGKKRLLIVADGMLHYIPFGALPEPNSLKEGERNTWISYVITPDAANISQNVDRLADEFDLVLDQVLTGVEIARRYFKLLGGRGVYRRRFFE